MKQQIIITALVACASWANIYAQDSTNENNTPSTTHISDYLKSITPVYNKPNNNLPTGGWWQLEAGATANGPLMGNGDMRVVLVGDKRKQLFSISETDMWTETAASSNVFAITTGGLSIETELGEDEGNLALNKPVTVCGEYGPTECAMMLVDGEVNTRWTCEPAQNNGNVKFWAVVDLGKEQTISRWVVKHPHAAGSLEEFNTKDFRLQYTVKGDPDGAQNADWIDADIVEGNSDDITDRVLSKSIRTRYVRLFIDTPTQSSNQVARIQELELYAKAKEEEILPFRQEQDMWNATITAQSISGFKTKTFVSAMENVMVTELWTEGAKTLPMNVTLWAKADDKEKPSEAGISGSTMWVTRATYGGLRSNGEPARWVSRNAITAGVLGAEAELTTDNKGACTASFNLEPGKKIYVYTVLAGGKDAKTHKEDALEHIQTLYSEGIDNVYRKHCDWWHKFWEKSYVRTYDDQLDKFYYGASYLLACANRAGVLPAGQYPFCLTDWPAWNGDYHMNQEFLGQNESFFSSNRLELLELQPIFDFVPTAKKYARESINRVNSKFSGTREGMLFPVSMGPWGVDTDPYWFGDQVSNANYTGMLVIWYYEYTKDIDWLREKGYEFIKDLANFWVSHIKAINEKTPDGKYITYGSTWEWTFGPNSIVDLGLIKTAMRSAIQCSIDLGVDAEMRPIWQDIFDNLADYPMVKQNGIDVFVCHDNATEFTGGPEIQMVYPAEAITKYSDSLLVSCVKNCIALNEKITDENRSKPYHSAIVASRIGYPIEKTIDYLKKDVLGHPLLVNSGIRENYTTGALHYNSEYVEFINSCMLQTHDDVVELFPSWLTTQDACFHGLRAKGAFIVSANYNGKKAETDSASVMSERGGTFTLLSPWPEGITVSDSKGNPVKTFAANRPGREKQHLVQFDTSAGETYFIKKNETTGITESNQEGNLKISVMPHMLSLETDNAQPVSVYTLSGIMHFNRIVYGKVCLQLPKGFYLINGKKCLIP